MATSDSQCLLVLLILVFPASGSLGSWSWSGTKPPTLPPVTEHPFVRCPYRACKWVPYATFSCPSAGCTEISTELGDDVVEIYLQNNDISIIPRLPYQDLKLLDLADNNISKIVDYAFEYCCDDMTTLLLPKNKLTSLTHNTLFGLNTLKYLYLQQNEFTTIPDVFSAVPKLERLDLSSNQITKIDTWVFSYLKDLKFLHLHRNRISKVSAGAFYRLRNLEWLELMENNITTLREEMFIDLPGLLHLDLNFNNITNIEEGAFNGLDNLKRLYIEHNLLTSLKSAMFEGLANLDELYIGYNYIQAIDEGVLPPNIVKLSLVYSHQLKKLENGSLAGLSDLNEVYINSCHNLQEIEVGAFTGDTTIEFLDLSNNHLQTLPEELVTWKQLDYLDLSGNPWNCDCHLEWMLEVNMKTTSRDMIRCETPLSIKGKFLNQLTYTDFRCEEDKTKLRHEEDNAKLRHEQDNAKLRHEQDNAKLRHEEDKTKFHHEEDNVKLRHEEDNVKVRHEEDYAISCIAALAAALLSFFIFLVLVVLVLFVYRCRHKMFPCFYTTTVGKYSSMHNTVSVDESGVQFEKKLPTKGIAV